MLNCGATELEIPAPVGVAAAVTSSLMGAVTFVALDQVGGSLSLAAIIGGLVVILTRVISIQFDLHLPRFKK